MKTKWTIDSDQSDVLIKMKNSTLAYLGGSANAFDGYVNFENNEIEDASVAFSFDVKNRNKSLEQIDSTLQLRDFIDTNEYPIISFKSTSFQKMKNNVNFFKGDLTIKDITKVVELEAEFIGTNSYNGNKKVAFEITGDIKREDFGLKYHSYHHNGNVARAKDFRLIANFEFTI